MILTILVTFVSLIGLIVLHEFGHFILAKKFGVKVEEFGIGFPPRLFGRKFGETLYSLNLLPFGAFVKIYGEEGGVENVRSFTAKPLWQRALIVLGGVVAFWAVSAILLSIVMGLGAPTAVTDEENHSLVDPKVQIAAVAPDSPAEKEGIKPGDTIKNLKSQISNLKIDKVRQVQDFTEAHKGEEIILTIQRGKEILDVPLVPRLSPPEGEGAMGVALIRTATKTYSWYQAPIQGVMACGNLTIGVVRGWVQALTRVIAGEPTGAQLMGPVGIFGLFAQATELGINYFLQFVAIIAIYIALFNILPIPAVDGGKLLFLGIEGIRRKPLNQKIEQNINALFFALLIILMIWVTIKDIARIF